MKIKFLESSEHTHFMREARENHVVPETITSGDGLSPREPVDQGSCTPPTSPEAGAMECGLQMGPPQEVRAGATVSRVTVVSQMRKGFPSRDKCTVRALL